MGVRRTRTIQGLCLLGFAFLALRPVGPLERALDAVLLTSRWLPELSVPLTRAQAAAGERPDADLRASEAAAREALEGALLAAAAPDVGLRRDEVAWVHGEVLARSRRSLDTLLVRVADPARVQRGQAVVSGDVFVGRVAAAPGPDQVAEVALVTNRDFRVSAIVQEHDGPAREWYDLEGTELVVGGLVDLRDDGPGRGRREGQVLGAHHPHDRERVVGRVVVQELSSRDPSGAIASLDLANGYRLGDLLPEPGEIGTRRERLAGVEAALDYEHGLYQVAILVEAGDPVRAPVDPLEAQSFMTSRLLLRGELAANREGRKIARGLEDGVEPGAAVIDGVRLVGRVERSGLGWSNVRLLGDPGLSLPGLAAIGDPLEPTPVALGRLVLLGRDATGRLRLRWSPSEPLLDPATGGPALAPLEATLWSGSGSPGLPRGLLLGSVLLPAGAGPHQLVVEPPLGSDQPGELRVAVGGIER